MFSTSVVEKYFFGFVILTILIQGVAVLLPGPVNSAMAALSATGLPLVSLLNPASGVVMLSIVGGLIILIIGSVLVKRRGK